TAIRARDDRPSPSAREPGSAPAGRRCRTDRGDGPADVQGRGPAALARGGAIGGSASDRSGTAWARGAFGRTMDDQELKPPPAPATPVARAAALPWILFIVALAIAVWALW